MKRSLSSFCIALVIAVSGVAAFGQNYRIKQTTSMQGMDMSTTVYVKGTRKRTESSGMMGMGADVATIEQCDLNRTVQVNDKKKLYFVTENRATTTSAAAPSRPSAVAKVTKGGTITQTSNITDTGERKQMFGLTARHLKTSMSMVSSSDACNKTDMSMETDGWYVDLPQFSCPMPMPQNPYSHGQRSGCQDTVVTKFTGGGKLGFPLEMTQTMRSGGEQGFTQTISTIEFSKATLDDGLFNVPADYKLANSSQDLYGRPDIGAIMSGRQEPNENDYGASSPNVPRQTGNMKGKRPGMIRVGVLMPTNRSGDSISTSSMQAYLASQLNQGKVEGFAVSSEADARAAGCDYLLTSDFSKLKQSTAGKVGGLFGKVTGAPVAGVYDAQVDFSLVSLADGKSAVKSKAANKNETNVDRAAEAVLSDEARTVLGAIAR